MTVVILYCLPTTHFGSSMCLTYCRERAVSRFGSDKALAIASSFYTWVPRVYSGLVARAGYVWANDRLSRYRSLLPR